MATIALALVLLCRSLSPSNANAATLTTVQKAQQRSEQQQQKRKLIVNGNDADPQNYKYFAVSGEGSFFLAGETRCGASLVHPDILVSAAHCQGAFNYEVLMYNEEDNDFTRSVDIVEQRRFPDYNIDNSLLNFDVLVRSKKKGSFFVLVPLRQLKYLVSFSVGYEIRRAHNGSRSHSDE